MNSGTSARKALDVFDSRPYETGYATGYRTRQFNYKKRAKERRLYFLKQKVAGAFLLVLTLFAVKLLEGDATVALITVPLGLGLIFSKEQLWTDSYYFDD